MENALVVPNGTEVSSTVHIQLVNQYRTFAKHTAANIIKLAETLVEAEDSLSKRELRQFCEDVGLEYDGSTYRKLMKIGKEVSRFEPFVERMPNNWTTVYKLASLDRGKFDQVTRDGRFRPMMTASEIDKIIGTQSHVASHGKRDVMIDLSGLEQNLVIEAFRAMKGLEQQYGFCLKARKEIEKFSLRMPPRQPEFMTEPRELVSELLRPQQLGDLTLPQRVINRFQRMIGSGSIMNMLFYGGPGLGKTSAARVFINALGVSSIEIDGSLATGVDFVRQRIVGFSSSVAFNGGMKLCFIDEADYVSQNAQAALRHVIEESSDNCRYLFAVNNISKLIPAIRSRLLEICFDIAPADRIEVQKRLFGRYERILSEAGISFDRERLTQIVGIYYPDLRSIANHIEFEFVY